MTEDRYFKKLVRFDKDINNNKIFNKCRIIRL